jgi:hypothetical protein
MHAFSMFDLPLCIREHNSVSYIDTCFIYLQEHRARLVAAEAARVAEEQARIEREQQLLNAKLAEESGRQSAKYVASRCIALLLISDNKPCLLST